jgi:hypothetical protein
MENKWKDLIDKCSIENRTQTQSVINSLIRMWGFDEEIICRVVLAMSGSFDEAEKYLSDMDAFEFEKPEDAWEQWCEAYDIEHEIDSNPFLDEFPGEYSNNQK